MSEIEPPFINNELTDQKPFVIRGHHLPIYTNLIKGIPYNIERVPTPAEEARAFRLFVENLHLAVCYDSASDSLKELGPGMIPYIQDVVGTSTESADRYEERLRKTFERCMSLPDDHPAELIEEMPDAMCEACAVGEHCRSRSFPNAFGVDTSVSRDPEALDQFLEKLRSLNLPEPVISYEQAHFPDADPEQVRRIKTTIGVVRKVLKQTDPEIWS